jgi:hypothetical protein
VEGVVTAIPPEAVTAAAVFIHDDECNDGDTETCGRWRCGSDPTSKFHSLHERHVEFYQARAQAILATAALHIAAAERKRIRDLAIERNAVYDAPCQGCPPGCIGCAHYDLPFADLLGGES